MATKNFIVQNGLTVGAVTIDATSGNITTTGAITSTGSTALSSSAGIQNTPIGNATPSSGAFTTLSTTGELTVGGNLTISGTTTTINATTVTVNDKNIVVANNQSTSTNVDGAGIDAGGGTPIATLRYNHSTTSWQSNVALTPSANASVNLGGTSNWWNNVYGVTFIGVATTAKYADLAENYSADAEYAPGTVLHFGGDAEVTQCNEDMCQRVAGVVTTNPAYLMNSDLSGTKAAIALQGRVPCRVVGAVSKGDMMVSAGNGAARAEANPTIGSVIGKALENFDGEAGVIEVVVGRV